MNNEKFRKQEFNKLVITLANHFHQDEWDELKTYYSDLYDKAWIEMIVRKNKEKLTGTISPYNFQDAKFEEMLLQKKIAKQPHVDRMMAHFAKTWAALPSRTKYQEDFIKKWGEEQ